MRFQGLRCDPCRLAFGRLRSRRHPKCQPSGLFPVYLLQGRSFADRLFFPNDLDCQKGPFLHMIEGEENGGRDRLRERRGG
jgi:hypothetical protein